MKIVAIVGTYREGGVIDTAVDEVLAGAAEAGAEIERIRLIDRHIDFCANCRACTQGEGPEPGKCTIEDDMGWIIEEIEGADAIVLASPMNFGTVTAVMKRFIERLVCFAYWPWGMGAPKHRKKTRRKNALVVASSAAPSWMARPTSGIVKLLKDAARLLGARTIGVVYVGLASMKKEADISARKLRKARSLGRKLATRRPRATSKATA